MVAIFQAATKNQRRSDTSSVDANFQPEVGSIVRRVLTAGGSDFSFPSLSGAEAAALMKAAGIVTETGKLTKNYR
jgi:hypothetical protein